jgi:short-subunit dehydrogenase
MPRPLNEQIVVITGASSGIGRETAINFAQRGATVVVAARNEIGLAEVVREIEQSGGRALAIPTDVSVWLQVEDLAARAISELGGIDTWVNNAAVSEYATVAEMTVEEIERIIQVDLLGQIYGIKAVLPHFRRRNAGTIINVASALADRAVPLQAAYSASKHGIKGFTESLRMELAHEQSGIAVTLVLPSSINTPFFRHSRSRMGVKPKPIPPVYEPKSVAEAIVSAAESPQRDVYVGGGGKMISLAQRISPTFVDRLMLMGGSGLKQQRTEEPDDGQDNLFAPVMEPGSTTGEFGKGSQPVSLYTRFFGLHPNRTRVAGAAMIGAIAFARRSGR